MGNLKSFINKIKEKNSEFKQNRKESFAHSKGFSSAKSYDTYSSAARYEGTQEAESKLRKQELKRIKEEAKEERMLGRYGKYGKFQKKVAKGYGIFQKGAGVYNDIIGGLQTMNSPRENSRQAYASGYGIYSKRGKSRTKKQKPQKRKHKSQASFWDQYW